MSVTALRTTARAAVLVLLTPTATFAQPAEPPLASPSANEPAAGPPSARQLLDRVREDILAERIVDETIAVQMLALNSQGSAAAEAHLAQALYGRAILAPALRAAAEGLDPAAQALLDLLARSEPLLKRERVPAEIIAAQRAYLALYHYGLPDKTPLRSTLDAIADAMASELVWPGLRGIYWNLKGCLATEDANFALALDCHTRARALRQEAGLPADEAESLNNLGYLLFRMGDHAAARRVLTDACDQYTALRGTASQPTSGELLARMNLAKAIEAAQEFDVALERFQELLLAAQDYPEPLRSRLDFQFRNNAAMAQYSLGGLAACERELTACRSVAVQQLGDSALHVAELDINLGWVAFATGRLPLAEERFAAAVQVLRAHHASHHRYAEALGYLARAKTANGDQAAARLLLDEALALRERQLAATLASSLSERDRLAYVQQLRVHPDSLSWPGALDTYLELAEELKISPAEQYGHVLTWKGALARHDNAQAQQTPAEARGLEAERAILRMRLMGIAPAARRKDPAALQVVVKLEREANDLERKLRALRAAVEPESTVIDGPAVAAALPAGGALWDLIEVRKYQPRGEGDRVGNDRVYIAFLVRASGEVLRLDLGRSAPINAAAQQFRERIEKRGAYEAPARRLDELVARPLQQALGETAQVVISADGALLHVPWAALPGRTKGFWVEETVVTTVPSAASLVARAGRISRGASPGWLAIGGVDYGGASPTGQKWLPLPATTAEAASVDRRLAAAFGNSARATLLSGHNATKKRVLELLGEQRCVHLATHGEFQNRRSDAFDVHDALAALDSVIVLAGANDDATGGAESLLTAEELAALDLCGVDLMVLSACQTGLGHVQAGQGQIGLLGALSQAGVGAVVASLWKVDDAATSQLMERFYVHALETDKRSTVSAALRRAQLDLVSQPSRQHPYFWAAWTVTGQPTLTLAP